ncbi:MAG TPA: Crp/Fnr family transcriptional regulator [Acidimicrobiia bacterium]|nr:Crp/Fnr family transcriptional regulator [Acidimicrobiia bacterium]
MEESPPGGDGDFLAELPPDAAEELRRLGARRRFPAGAVLFVTGDPAHEALVLLSGEVKVSVGSAEGKEIVLEVFEAGALLGELSVIDGKPRSATVTALTPVEVLAVAAGSFNDFLDRHPKVLRRLLIDVIGRLRSRVRHQLEFGAGDALGRVCARLADLADRYGEPDGDVVVVHSPLNQSELAAWTGLSREAVVKALRALRQLEWVDVRGRTLVVRDLDRLRARATQ